NNGSQPNNPPSTGSNTPSEFQVNPPSAAHKAELDKALANTNKLRQDKGLPPLKYDPALAAYAQKRAEEIVQLYEHQRPNGQSWKDGVKNGAAAENITAGYGSADKAVLEQWRNSAGHYKNMTNAAYTRIGIGLVHVPNSPHGYYWVQIFGDDNTTTDYRFNNGTSSRAVLFRAVAASPAPDVLYLDGEAVPLLPQGKRDWHAIDAANHTGVFGGNTQYSRYGIVKRHDDDRYRAFSQGLPTPLAQMPQSGSVRYLGQGVAASGMERQYFHADLRADFDRKALHGTLSGAHGRLDVNALIRGNTFATPDHAEVCAKGGFYGTHASELSGTFDVRADGRTGAFGAVRQGD
ncbi:CAP domain-containing protein, partial [Conchiformibius kuhniae]